MRREQTGLISTNWGEIKRIAKIGAYANWPDVKALTNEQAKALKVRSPYDSEGPSD